MALIDKDKTVEAIATYLFVNDAIRGPEPRRIADYLVFAQSMLTDVPETEVVRCKECRWWIVAMDENNSDEDYLKCSMDKWPNADDFCSYGERSEP